ncbi:MAG: PD-(D/E)XK nuclease family protein [Nitrospira sp.]|nr:PD-(D/E)XK nuclease family protein [Nitrospira sp.]
MSDYQLLLEGVARLHKRYEAGRRKPFNVFSVLRRESDEVNLHSRFLHALLDYRKSPEAERENLKDFLQHVAENEFEEKRATVEREGDHIDILITNKAKKQAIGIENKIYSEDQYRQLERYHNTLKRDYRDVHLLYLTLHGDEPSEDSVGGLDPKTYKTISYKDDLLLWLERCQKRAYDEPALRESVAQYRQLVRKLTSTDLTEAYMSELKQLLLQDNNLVLAHTLIEATTEVHIELLKKLWDEIDSELRNKIRDLPRKGSDSDISPERIRDFVTSQKNFRHHGLYYPFGNSGAGVEVERSIFFGVYCHESSHENEYNKLREALKDVTGGTSTSYWPWRKYANEDLDLKNPTQETFQILSNKEKRKEYVAGIVSGLVKVWGKLKAEGLAR